MSLFVDGVEINDGHPNNNKRPTSINKRPLHVRRLCLFSTRCWTVSFFPRDSRLCLPRLCLRRRRLHARPCLLPLQNHCVPPRRLRSTFLQDDSSKTAMAAFLQGHLAFQLSLEFKTLEFLQEVAALLQDSCFEVDLPKQVSATPSLPNPSLHLLGLTDHFNAISGLNPVLH